MKRLAATALFTALSFAVLIRAEEPKGDAKKLPATVTPAPKDPQRHSEFVALTKQGNIELLFLGDSITNRWRNPDQKQSPGGKQFWDEYFAPLKAANFGIGGDKTQNVLWRIQNGELDGIAPKLVVLMIGTNNTESKEDVALGIETIVKEIRIRSPQAKILLLAIFPRGDKPDNPARVKNDAVNALISKLDDGGAHVKYVDIGTKFLDASGKLRRELMPDVLHPNTKGYEVWTDAMLPTVKEMMGVK